MGFWMFMLVMNLLIPLAMLGFGWIFLKHPPKEVNAFYGYRTSMSMKNKDTWAFAHKYFGKLWYAWGGILLPVTVIAMLFVIGKAEDVVGKAGAVICFVQMIVMIGLIFPTEIALRRTFDKKGNRK